VRVPPPAKLQGADQADLMRCCFDVKESRITPLSAIIEMFVVVAASDRIRTNSFLMRLKAGACNPRNAKDSATSSICGKRFGSQ
jgi:hypothetical protein